MSDTHEDLLDEYSEIEDAAIKEMRKRYGRASNQPISPTDYLEYWIFQETQKRYAARLEQAVEAEREAIAKFLDHFLMTKTSLDVEKVVAIVEAIRARGAA